MSDTMEKESPAGLGHNLPPQPLDAAEVPDWLEIQFTDLRTRRDALVAAVARFRTNHVTIDDDETQGQAAEFMRQLRGFLTTCEGHRATVGAPYLDCTAALNRYFAGLTTQVDAGRVLVNKTMKVYADAKKARVKAQRDALAQQRRAAADAAERRAMTTQAEPDWNRAVETAKVAEKADKAAGAGVADLSRVRGEQGAVASLAEHWTYEEEDLSLVPREFMVIDPALVRAAIAAGVREIAGLRIFNETRMVAR
jgi:hypothetical protein